MSDTEDDEIRELRMRLDEVRRLHHEAWLLGISVGGGVAARATQIPLEEEGSRIEARLIELGEKPAR